MVTALVPFSSFERIPLIFFDCVGLVPYGRPNIFKEIFFIVSFTWLSLCLIGEYIFFFSAIDNFTNFLDLTALAPCMGFVTLSLVKMTTVRMNRGKLNVLVDTLKIMFPDTLVEQEKYKVRSYMLSTNYMMKLFSTLLQILIWIFNLWALFDSLYMYYLDSGVWVKQLPYFIWYPYDVFEDGVFEVNVMLQIWAGFITICGVIAVDLLFCSVITQICMHFDILGNDIKNFGGSTRMEYKTLRDYAKRHQLLIQLSTDLEDIYSPSLFVNFLLSSLLICLAGFQTTAPGVKIIVIVKSALLLISSMVQIFLLCWFGNKMIDCSSGIGDATYQCLWYKSELKFMKSMALIIHRAQKPQKFTAYKFSVVSIPNFSKILSTSYSYFALLKTMFDTSG